MMATTKHREVVFCFSKSLQVADRIYRNPERIPNKRRINNSGYLNLTGLHTAEIAKDLS
jgi:hypothetical protein